MIKNLTKNTLLANKFTCPSGFGKIKGLIGETSCKPIVFRTRFGIHTFFLKFPIDVIIADKSKKIVLIEKGLKPGRFLFWNPKYDTVIELPSGTLEKSKSAIGDTLEFFL